MADDKTEDQTQESEELEQAASVATEEPKEVEAPAEEVEAPAETPEPEADEQPEEPQEEPEEAPVSKRENKRIQELTRKLAESQQFQPQNRQRQTAQPFGDQELSAEEANAIAEQYASQSYQQGVAQANSIAFNTRLEIDVPKVAQKYEVLDQNSDQFDPGVAAFINESYLRHVGYDANTGAVQNNNIRYEEYVEAQMELVEALSASKSADSSRNLAKQAAQTGLRPGGIAKKDYAGDDPSKMTLEQLQAAALQEAKSIRF